MEITTTSISEINVALKDKTYDALMENTNLFWQTFCMTYASTQEGSQVLPSFTASLDTEALTIRGKPRTILEIKNAVEQIRTFFLQGRSERTHFLFCAAEGLPERYHFRKYTEVLDLTDHMVETKHPISVHRLCIDACIAPVIPYLAETVGASAVRWRDSHKAILMPHDPPTEQRTYIFEVTWEPSYLTYTIPPITVPPQTSEAVYTLYQKQLFCDFSLIAKDGQALHVHATALFASGSETMRTMLLSSMTEATEKRIRFEEFSLSTLKAFAEFMYLGEKGLPVKFLEDEAVDLSELMKMAHMYHFRPLFDHCSNLLSLCSETEDADKIQTLANLYSSPYLDKLAGALRSKQAAAASPSDSPTSA